MRFLMIVAAPWDRRLGAARVQLELAEQYEALGHQVDVFSIEDAYARISRWERKRSRGMLFAREASRHVSTVGHRYDVIEAGEGDLPRAPAKVSGRPLIACRSVGSRRFYDDFLSYSRRVWPEEPLPHPAIRRVRSWERRKELELADLSVRAADLVLMPNRPERDRALRIVDDLSRVHLMPFGLTRARRAHFERATSSVSMADRYRRQRVAFVGSWTTRKGARDWPSIVRSMRAALPDVEFVFLGTGTDRARVLKDLDLPTGDEPRVVVIPTFESDELPDLLAGSTLGLFPSYVEGFPFGVLEMLTAGLPVIGYDTPGVSETLRHTPSPSLVAAADVAELAHRAVGILTEPIEAYSARSIEARAEAAKYRWEDIAEHTLSLYTETSPRRAS